MRDDETEEDVSASYPFGVSDAGIFTITSFEAVKYSVYVSAQIDGATSGIPTEANVEVIIKPPLKKEHHRESSGFHLDAEQLSSSANYKPHFLTPLQK